MDSRTRRTQNKKEDAAEVGIGTMIVFIAAILVAAIAAGVLINTAQKLQAKSQQTGSEASQNVASALSVMRVDGVRTTEAGVPEANLAQLDLTVQLAAGADPVDLSKLVILLDTGSGQVQLTGCADAVAAAADVDPTSEFYMDSLRGGVADCGVMNAGDLVQLHLGFAHTAAATDDPISSTGIGTGQKVSVSLIPAHGTAAVVGFTTPDGYGDSVHLGLF